jgi:transposase
MLANAEAEGVTDKDLEALVLRALADQPRSGAPPKFAPEQVASLIALAEQVASLIALACESPADSGLPVSHWTPPELAREAVKRGIFESISPRQVDRFLARRSYDHTRVSTG